MSTKEYKHTVINDEIVRSRMLLLCIGKNKAECDQIFLANGYDPDCGLMGIVINGECAILRHVDRTLRSVMDINAELSNEQEIDTRL